MRDALGDRRAFLRDLARWGAGAAAAPAALAAFAREVLADTSPYREVEYSKRLDGDRVQCFVCPLNCVLDHGLTCFCNTRRNHGGKLLSHAFANPCILRTDPIEKLPLNHFLPGTRTLSIAVGGCNLRCLYCQNWQQSMVRPESLKTWRLPPEQAAAGALEGELPTIALTYTEPVAFLEYAFRIAEHARRRGVKVVAATGAYINPGPMRDFAKRVDGMCCALKGFDETFYRDVIGGELKPVLDALVAARETGVWLEIATLVVPTLNDDLKKVRRLAVWVKRYLGEDTPLHFARFVPEYRLKNLPRTPVPALTRAREEAQAAGLRYVYTTNVAPHEGSATSCARCHQPRIRRVGFRILENQLNNGSCPRCTRKVPGVWS
ncbi:MAG: AmmeMemoRadiSam system radical SAM enzyme [Planctomycetota bacterium]